MKKKTNKTKPFDKETAKNQGFHPGKTEHLLLFASDGKVARIMHNIQKKDDKRIFYLQPTALYKWRRNIKKDIKDGYDEEQDWWKKEIPEHLVFALDDGSPLCFFFVAFCDWNLNEDNPFKDKFEGSLLSRVGFLKEEVKNYREKVRQQNRIIRKMAIDSTTVAKDIVREWEEFTAKEEDEAGGGGGMR